MTGIVRTEESVTRESMRNILRGGTRTMIATRERRVAIATRTDIALLAIDPLTATMRVTTVDLKVRKVGLVYLIVRVSHTHYLNLSNYGLQ